MSTELAVFNAAELSVFAKNVAASRLYPGIQNEQAAFTLMALCLAEGLHPIKALQRYHIIEGRPSMRADAMQAEFQRLGGVVRWIKSTDEECSASFLHPIHAPDPGFAIHVTLAALIESGVAKGYNKDKGGWEVKKVYRQHPAAMLRARVISQGVRAVLPGVVAGIYTPEEVEDFDDKPKRPEGRATPPAPGAEETIDVTPGPVPPPEASGTPRGAREACASPGGTRPLLEFLRDEVTRTNCDYTNECALGNAPPDRRGDILNVHQAINGVVSLLIARGAIDASEVEPLGKRDRAKARAKLESLYLAKPNRMSATIRVYLDDKLNRSLVAAGLRDWSALDDALDDAPDDAPDDAGGYAAPVVDEAAGEGREPGEDG